MRESIIRTERQVIIHTESLQQIMSKKPKWIIRWGITIVLCLFICFFVLSGLLYYPEVLELPIKLEEKSTNNESVFKAQYKVSTSLDNQKNSSINSPTISKYNSNLTDNHKNQKLSSKPSLKKDLIGFIILRNDIHTVKVEQIVLIEVPLGSSNVMRFKGKIVSKRPDTSLKSSQVFQVKIMYQGSQMSLHKATVGKAKVIIENTTLRQRIINVLKKQII
jgi:hypothetical protein